MSKIIVMIGAPGAGKGTQARLLSEKYGYPQISTGDILREMAQADTPEGRDLKQIMAAGKLVSDDVLADLIEKRTSRPDCQNGYILDGYPRTVVQAQQLEEMAAWQKKEVLLVRVVVFEDELMKRLTGRRTCKKCGEIYNINFRPPQIAGVCDRDGGSLSQRADDNAETVKRRLSEYQSATAPLIDYYGRNGRLIEVDGQLPVDEVFEKLCHVIDNFGIRAA
ncbi:MAG: adenylate kinase [Acidobacteria bacterium]|nr:adenylate kinase [Acidobacteriota bacterium]